MMTYSEKCKRLIRTYQMNKANMSQSSLRSLEVLGKKLLKYTCLVAVVAKGLDDVTDLATWEWRAVCWTVMISKLPARGEWVSLDSILSKSLTFRLSCKSSKPSASLSEVTPSLPLKLLINLTALRCTISIWSICLARKGSHTSQTYSKRGVQSVT